MRTLAAKILIALTVAASSLTAANAGWGGVRVGIGIGIPYPYPYYYRPYYYGYPYYPYPATVVVPAPPPTVVVQPAPAAAPAAPAGSGYQQAPPTLPAPTPVSSAPVLQTAPPPLAPAVARSAAPDDAEHLIQLLRDPGEGTRISAAMQLGREKQHQAVDSLIQMLNNDTSPRARDAAARALGLIAAPSSLNALQTAAQADDDHEVRQSARFAAEVIRGNLRR
jgi:hypothetical protein